MNIILIIIIFIKIYQYTTNIQLLIKDIIIIENNIEIKIDVIVLRNKNKILNYLDIKYNNKNEFIRIIDNNKFTFNLNGLLLNKESIIKSKFIKQEKRELILDNKILTFEIECYVK
jgi:hypothetical protein